MATTRGEPVPMREIVGDAIRAPSAHNVQPARWAFRRADARVALLRDPARSLPVADPTSRDEAASLGAALEGFAIAASTRGLAVHGLVRNEEAARAFGANVVGGFDVVATFHLADGVSPDPLAPCVDRRRAWRGQFGPADEAEGAIARFADAANAHDAMILGRELAPRIATLIDRATWRFERRADYHAELWEWLRLDPRDPRYRRDGLTAEALLLSAPARAAGRVLMRPTVFRVLQATGLGRHLVSERAATESAACFICHCSPADRDPFDVGRGMYRLWLAATAAGLVLAPMSAIVDDADTRVIVEQALGLDASRRLTQVFRAGTIRGEPPRSPRLPVEEMFVEL